MAASSVDVMVASMVLWSAALTAELSDQRMVCLLVDKWADKWVNLKGYCSVV